MSHSRLLNSSPAGFWETWLPAVCGDFIIVIRLLAYVLLLCAVPSLLASKVSEVLGTTSAIFLTSIYVFFQMDIFEQSVTTPISRASSEVETPSSETNKTYTRSFSSSQSNILRRTCAAIGKCIDNKKNLPKEIADNLMIAWGDNESSHRNITGPEITRKKFKILFFLLAATILLLILFVPGFNALGPVAVSKYLISKAVQPGIAHFATALLFGGFTYALRAPLVVGGIVLRYFLTTNKATKERLIGLTTDQHKKEIAKEKEEEKKSQQSTTMLLEVFSSSSPSNQPLIANNFSTGYNGENQEKKMIKVAGKFDPNKLPNIIVLKIPDKKKKEGEEELQYEYTRPAATY